jgi:eukaryotic-like serine/threonine-protein kinase
MTPEEILQGAVDKKSPLERAAFLEGACGPNGTLRAQLEGLLKAHEEAGSFLEQPLFEPPPPADSAPLAERPGTVIGPYKLMEQIGEGGFGVVFMAEQQQPIRRKVAVKVLKPGMDTRYVVARFEAERQALAIMDHPNIARVFDGGATASGRPYFVMELVEGVPITKYCDEYHLTLKQRLDLFLRICEAVHHAHQKGVIHRDLKPSNVLVAERDEKPVLKVIDFGVAKAVGQQLAETTIVTGCTQMIGTPLYMSPEQAGGGGLDVDTRSDIYSLGVLLYELLTGTTPFDRERFKTAPYDEIRRIIRDEEVPKPSTRLSKLGRAATAISAQRESDPKRLGQLLRGELDWIVMKALEKDRNRRYDTASAFAADVQRYLANEPVLAGPPSTWYRYRKFARRHRASLATAGLVLLLILSLGGLIGWLVRDRVARQHETERGVLEAVDQAEMYLGEGEQQMDNPVRWQMTVALAEGAVRRAEELLATGAATAALTDRMRQFREAVDTARRDSEVLVALDRIELEKATVKDGYFDYRAAGPRYAAILLGYGVDPAAPTAAAARVSNSRIREALLAALENWRQVTADEPERQRLEAVLGLAEPAPGAFRARWLSAVRRRDKAALAQLAGEPATQDLPPIAIVRLAQRLIAVNEWAAAERLLRRGLERFPGNFWLNHDLGIVLGQQNPPRCEEAVRYLTAALALRSDSPGVYYNLGAALCANKDLDGAIRAFQAALKIDPNYTKAWCNLGIALTEKKDLDGAVRACQAALRIDPQFANAHIQLGNVLLFKDDGEGAIREYQAALEINPKLGMALFNLGRAYAHCGQWKQALNPFTKAMEQQPYAKRAREQRLYAFLVVGLWVNASRELAPRGLDAAPLDDTWFQLACVRVLQGDAAGYRQLCMQWLERIGQSQESLSADTAYRSSRTCMLQPGAGVEPAQGVRWAEQALANRPKCEWYLHGLALAHYRAGQYDLAIARCQDSINACPGWAGNPQNWLLIGLAHKRLDQTQEASEWLDKATRWRAGALVGKHEPGIAYPPDVALSDWLEFQVLYREAETLLKE